MNPFFVSLGRFLIFILFSPYLYAQIKISDLGNGTPHPSAILELESSQKNKVFVLPRLSETERRNIPYKVNGLMVFDNTFNDIYIYHENEWYPAVENRIILSNEFGLIDENDNMVFSGDSTLTKATTGRANMGFGFESLKNTLTGESNLGIGVRSLTNNLHGSDNIAIGHDSQKNNLSGNKNISIGFESLFNNRSGNNNIALGNFAIQGSGNDIGSDNIGLGHQALYKLKTGYENIAVGTRALGSLTTGYQNIAIGIECLTNIEEGNRNTAVGHQSMFNAQPIKLVNCTDAPSLNTAYGAYSLYSNEIGKNNVAIGESALHAAVRPHNNVAIGSKAAYRFNNGYTISNGEKNTIIGTYAAPNVSFGESFSHNIVLGDSAATNLGYGENNIIIANSLGLVGQTDEINEDELIGVNNQLVIGNSIFLHNIHERNNSILSLNTRYFSGNYQLEVNGDLHYLMSFTLSDQRLKTNIRPLKYGLKILRLLNPVSYHLKEDIPNFQTDNYLHYGFIAQELSTIIPELVLKEKTDQDFQAVNYYEMIPVLIQSLKEIHSEIESIKKTLKAKTNEK